VQNHYNLAHRADDLLIDQLAREGIAYVPFFPLGGFSPLQSSTLSNVAARLDVCLCSWHSPGFFVARRTFF
jgi:pyridoxine 4-dehydrogenase